MKPIDEQVKGFWERCGLKHIYQGTNGRWYYYEHQGGVNIPVPPIDLNSLFEYAVPLAVKAIMADQECDEELAYAILFKKWQQIGYDALALFGALRKVLFKKGTK